MAVRIVREPGMAVGMALPGSAYRRGDTRQPKDPRARSTTMLLDWNAYQQQLLAGVGQIAKITPASFAVIASSATPAAGPGSSTRRPVSS